MGCCPLQQPGGRNRAWGETSGLLGRPGVQAAVLARTRLGVPGGRVKGQLN